MKLLPKMRKKKTTTSKKQDNLMDLNQYKKIFCSNFVKFDNNKNINPYKSFHNFFNFVKENTTNHYNSNNIKNHYHQYHHNPHYLNPTNHHDQYDNHDNQYEHNKNYSHNNIILKNLKKHVKGLKEIENLRMLDKANRIISTIKELLETDPTFIGTMDVNKISESIKGINIKSETCRKIMQKYELIDDGNDISIYQKELETGYARLTKRLKIYDGAVEDVQCYNQLRKLDKEIKQEATIEPIEEDKNQDLLNKALCKSIENTLLDTLFTSSNKEDMQQIMKILGNGNKYYEGMPNSTGWEMLKNLPSLQQNQSTVPKLTNEVITSHQERIRPQIKSQDFVYDYPHNSKKLIESPNPTKNTSKGSAYEIPNANTSITNYRNGSHAINNPHHVNNAGNTSSASQTINYSVLQSSNLKHSTHVQLSKVTNTTESKKSIINSINEATTTTTIKSDTKQLRLMPTGHSSISSNITPKIPAEVKESHTVSLSKLIIEDYRNMLHQTLEALHFTPINAKKDQDEIEPSRQNATNMNKQLSSSQNIALPKEKFDQSKLNIPDLNKPIPKTNLSNLPSTLLKDNQNIPSMPKIPEIPSLKGNDSIKASGEFSNRDIIIPTQMPILQGNKAKSMPTMNNNTLGQATTLPKPIPTNILKPTPVSQFSNFSPAFNPIILKGKSVDHNSPLNSLTGHISAISSGNANVNVGGPNSGGTNRIERNQNKDLSREFVASLESIISIRPDKSTGINTINSYSKTRFVNDILDNSTNSQLDSYSHLNQSLPRPDNNNNNNSSNSNIQLNSLIISNTSNSIPGSGVGAVGSSNTNPMNDQNSLNKLSDITTTQKNIIFERLIGQTQDIQKINYPNIFNTLDRIAEKTKKSNNLMNMDMLNSSGNINGSSGTGANITDSLKMKEISNSAIPFEITRTKSIKKNIILTQNNIS